ncbi:MAG: ribose-phosphate pyrophosphokinase, partial [Bacteroidetes bacterium]|nr:ribose-phosphate pyrophosphokinase [Bacteroidota bacterium]
MLKAGAKSVRAFATHPVFSANALERLEKSQMEEIVVCDTIPLARSSEKITVLSVASLFARGIHNVYEHESISSLFDMPDSFQKEIKF